MRKLLSVFAVAVFSGAAVNASPLISVGDEIDIYFTGMAKGAWNSNVYLTDAVYKDDGSRNKVDDYYMLLRAGLEATYGRNTKFKMSVRAYEDFRRYLSQTHANADLTTAELNATYTEERWAAIASFRFWQVADNSETVRLMNDVAHTNNYMASGRFLYDVTEKVNTDIGFIWQRVEYTNYNYLYSDRDTYAFPVSLLYRMTEKVNAGITYQFRTSYFWNGNGASSQAYGNTVDDHFVGLTVRGELLPKLRAEASVGGAYRDMVDINRTDSTISFSARFDYDFSDKLSFYALGFRDFGAGASRQAVVNTGMRAGVHYTLFTNLRLYAAYSYTNSEYDYSLGRMDDGMTYNAGISYLFLKYFEFAANYSFLDNDSNSGNCSYTRHLVEASIRVRY